MQQIICKTGCIQSVGGAIDSTAAQYTITAHVKLYNAVQSARLTVVLQKNVQTWSGTWDDIFARPWPFLIPVKLFRMKYARNAMFQPSPAHIFLWTNKFHPFTIVVLHQKGRKRNHSWENVHSLQDCSSFSPRTI